MSTQQATASDELQHVQRHAETIKNDETFKAQTMEPGDVFHQGDLTIVCVKGRPKSAKPRADRQLAIGSTQGSRHMLTTGACFDANKAECRRLIKDATGQEVPDYAIGPVITTPALIEHPEHGDHDYSAVGEKTCIVTYQRSLDAEEREVRAQD